MALMKKHQMDITEFSEKSGIKEELLRGFF